MGRVKSERVVMVVVVEKRKKVKLVKKKEVLVLVLVTLMMENWLRMFIETGTVVMVVEVNKKEVKDNAE